MTNENVQERYYYVYIMTNERNTTLYTGVTNDLPRRVMEHKEKTFPKSFSAKYNLTKLVYYEAGEDISGAIEREKQIKSWSRKKKEEVITSVNPTWKDLTAELLEG
ncbi:MAG: GIY-YIG nuclease family protein [Patescibacteria group bacterium]|jgi:putative endonuclease